MSAIAKRVMTFTSALMLLGALPVSAQLRRGAVVVAPRVVVHQPLFFEPFWGAWYPYAYAYPYRGRPIGSVRTDVTPKDTEVYVDGYYAGPASQFDGVFQGLRLSPGGHAFTFRLDGFRTITRDAYVRADSTFKLKATMDHLAAGETAAPVPAPPRPVDR
jgi:hypothetical protein